MKTLTLLLAALAQTAPPPPAGYKVVHRLEGTPQANRLVFKLPPGSAKKARMIGFTWKASKSGNQTVLLGTTPVLPATQPLSYHAKKTADAHLLLPLVPPFSEALHLAFDGGKAPPGNVADVVVLEKIDDAKRTRIALVTGEDYAGHHWQKTTPELEKILAGDSRLEVSRIECPNFLASPLLGYYDAVVFHFKDIKLKPDPAALEGLKRFVSEGGGLALVHFACGAFQNQPAFVEVAGRVWNPKLRGHDPRGPFEVRIADDAHPVVAGMKKFETTDELYTCLEGKTGIRVLAEAVSKVDKKTYPMAFVLSHGKGRVFHSVLGHDVKAFEAPAVRELYHRGVVWSAGLEIKQGADR